MRKKHVLLGVAACSALWAMPAFAQDQTTAEDEGEIIVTARKRAESILKVPVVETVVSQETLENYQITDIVRLAAKVPGLVMGSAVLAIGPQVSIRGVGTSTLDAGVDQSTSLNLDGLSMSQGTAFKAGLFDLAQIEVLKGPQALFFGKNAPAGVISLRTNDPGDELEVIARAGYEFEANERRGELILSMPVSDTLGIRLAGMVSDMEGFFRNKATAQPGRGGKDPRFTRISDTFSYVFRGTVVWEPTSDFDARLKLNYTRDDVQGDASQGQLVSCPDGLGPVPPLNVQWLNPNDDCTLDRDFYIVSMEPTFYPGIRNNGIPFFRLVQKFGTLELNYRPTAVLTLTSVTGYYRSDTDSFINSTQTGFSGPPFVTDNRFHRKDFTQELRLNSEFSGPLNFTLGAFYQDGEVFNLVTRHNNPLFQPTPPPVGSHTVKIKVYSAFGQLRWRPIPELELAGGVRWTDEKRSDDHFNLATGSPVPIPLAVPEIRSKNWSPEFTITYTPTDDLTLFGSVKQGYKSGSYTITQRLAPNTDNSFGDEKVRGGEIGLKARLLDRAMFVNLAGYYYKYKGLQVGANTLDPVTNLPFIKTLNAGGAKVYGVDFDITYRPPSIDGLSLNGAINWNHARFTELIGVPCWGGQTFAEGCNVFPRPATAAEIAAGTAVVDPATGALVRFTSQDLSGLRLVRAPEWQLQAGADYETPVGNGMMLRLGVAGQYSSKYPAALSARRDTWQDGYFTLNANVALSGNDEQWEVALIGNNITNEITAGSCSLAGFQAGVIFGGVNTGGTGRGPAGIDEVTCVPRRGREVWVRVTIRPRRE